MSVAVASRPRVGPAKPEGIPLEARITRFARTPKGQLLVVLVAIIAVGAPTGIAWGDFLSHLLWPIVAATAADLILQRVTGHRWELPTGAPLTGLLIAMILAADSPWYVGVIASLVGIIAKYWVRIRREHIFNPAALGLLVVGLAFTSGQDWWGALPDLPWPSLALPLLGGLYIVVRINKLPLVLTFFGAYFGLWTLTSFVNATVAAEMFRPPFLQSALFLALFMITDPPTSPIQYREQVWFGVIAAWATCAAAVLGAGQIFLLIGVLVANLWLGGERLARWLQLHDAGGTAAPAQ